MNDFQKLADDQSLQITIDGLKANGISSVVVESGQKAKEKVLEIVPKGAEIITMTSVTLKDSGITKIIDESGDYNSIRKKLSSMDRSTQDLEMQKLGAAPEWVVGSVHAVTQNGQVVVASNSGSQLGPYVYGSLHVIWVVGIQKIVKNLDEAFKRINEYILPLESKRLSQAVGKEIKSHVSKILIFNKETQPDRILIIFVKEVLGF